MIFLYFWGGNNTGADEMDDIWVLRGNYFVCFSSYRSWKKEPALEIATKSRCFHSSFKFSEYCHSLHYFFCGKSGKIRSKDNNFMLLPSQFLCYLGQINFSAAHDYRWIIFGNEEDAHGKGASMCFIIVMVEKSSRTWFYLYSPTCMLGA